MLIEFERFFRRTADEGEDDGVVLDPQTSHVGINPVHVASVLGSERHDNACVVHMCNGKSYMVLGTYRQTMEKLGTDPQIGSEP